MNNNNRNYRIDPERGIVVPNYCAAQLPKITVEIKSAIIRKRIKKRGEMFSNGCYNKRKQSCIGRLPAD